MKGLLAIMTIIIMVTVSSTDGANMTNGLCSKLDIVFVLDSSGSVNKHNWKKVLQFVVDISQKLNIGPLDARIGIVVFGNEGKVGFNLGEYDTKESLKEAILVLDFLDEETNTSGGLYKMMSMFSVDLGGRSRAPNIAVIVTDGVSTLDSNKTIPFANDAKQLGILMMTVGVGNESNSDELHGMATNSSYVFSVNDFNALKAIENTIVLSVCDVPVPCRTNTDVAFILDASGSVKESNFELMKTFLKSIVDKINVEKDFMSNIGLMTYSNEAKVIFNLHEHNSRFVLKREIGKATYTHGSTNTADALRKLRTEMFRSDKGDRPVEDKNRYTNIAVLLTDGSSNDFDETIKEAKLAKQAGITIVVIALGNWFNKNELKEIASDPDSSYYFHVDFNKLPSITASVAQIVCDTEVDCHYNHCGKRGQCIEHLAHHTCNCISGYAGPNCNTKCDDVDLAIALDTSGSVGENNFYEMLSYTKEIINSINVKPLNGSRRSRVAMETYSNGANVRFHLDEFKDKTDIINELSYSYKGGATNTAEAIRTMRESMFSRQHGDRIGYRNVGLLITDGRSLDPEETFKQAAAARAQGIDLLTVGVKVRENKYVQKELRGITNDPDSYNLFNVDNFSSLSNITLKKVVNAICNSKDECQTSANQCKNGAICKDLMNGFECICKEGYTGKYCDRHCDGESDIVIAIDASGSIRQKRYYQVLDFLADLVDDLSISNGKTQVGVIIFGDNAYRHFNLNRYQKKQDIMQAIKMAPYKRGKTNIASAIRMMREEMFTSNNGDRQGVPNYGILVTDGKATIESDETLKEAIKARMENIVMSVVALGTDKKTLELTGIASSPADSHLYMIKNYTLLPSLLPKLIEGTCDSINECDNSPCANGKCVDLHGTFQCNCDYNYAGRTCDRRCRVSKDIALVLDASGSIETSFEMTQRIARQIVYGLNYDSGLTRTSVVTYSDNPTIQFRLDQYTDKRSTLGAITYLLERGRTNTAKALEIISSEVFRRNNGDRDGVDNVVIVLTDGNSNVDHEYTLKRADSLKNERAQMYSIGIGPQVDLRELAGIADSGNSFWVESENDINRVVSSILDNLCA